MRTSVSRTRDRCWHGRCFWAPSVSACALALVLSALAGLGAPAPAEARVCDRVAASGYKKVNGPRKLIRRLRPGQVGCLHAGTYRRRQLVIRKPRITIRSYPGERATWKGRIVIKARRVTLSHLNLDGTRGAPCIHACFAGEDTLPSPTINGRGARLLGNDIANRRGICVNLTRYYRRSPHNFRIERNRIHDCRPANNHIHGIYVVTGRGGVIRDNVIYANGDKGIVFFPNARDELVENNTIDGNRTGVHFGGGETGASSRITVRRNIVSYPTPRDGWPARFNVEYYWPGPVGRSNFVRRNCVYTASSDEFFRGRPARSGIYPERLGLKVSRSVVGEPRYANRGAGDYRLRPDSPCAGMGARRQVAAADAWCKQVEPPGARRRLYSSMWTAARRSCFGPTP